MTTAITKTEVKNSKKGFTLVELVVVIAILAILAAIAIPVVSTIINTSSKNAALTDGQTIELAIKEAQADITAKNPDTYGTKATAKSITIADVKKAKAIEQAFDKKTVNNKDYEAYWNSADAKVYFLDGSGATAKSVDDKTPKAGGTLTKLIDTTQVKDLASPKVVS